MRKTKDQKDLQAVLKAATDARDAAYSLFSRRLDTRRNLDSFIALRDAFNSLKMACAQLQQSVDLATEAKSSDQNTVMEEIMVRSGRMIIVDEPEKAGDPTSQAGPATILDFPKK